MKAIKHLTKKPSTFAEGFVARRGIEPLFLE